MLNIISRFFEFCGEKNKKKFQKSIIIAAIQAIFEAFKIPAIACMVKALLSGSVTAKDIFLCLGIMLVSIVGAGIMKNKSTMLQTEAGYETCANKRIEIAEHMRYIPMGYFNKNSLGQITAVTTNTMQNLEGVATRVVMMVAQGLLNTAVITIMLLLFDYRVALILLVGLVLFFTVNNHLMNRANALAPEKDRLDTELVDQVMEYLSGIPEVKAFGLTGERSQELNHAIDENERINTSMELTFVPLMGLQTLIVKLCGVAMMLSSILFYLNGSMDLMVCIVMIISAFIVYSSLETAGSYSSLLRTVDLCVSKAQAILEAPQMDIDGKNLDPVHRNIEAEHLVFSYEDRRIIDDVSFTIPENTTTAIVGPSGGGKTTLTSLISRFWDVDGGHVLLDGTDIRDYSMDSLMKNFSFVFQNVYLFHDTIANNIRFGQPEASMDLVMDAAKKACCHDFIMQLPDGYDTVIGEGGDSLSGGEKQRISIARAIMKDAPIIILDEATANVDPENEKELMDAIDALTRQKTIIMIAHRLKTVQNADQILVVDHGHIVQRGTHDSLMKEEGIYRRFIDARQSAASWKITVS